MPSRAGCSTRPAGTGARRSGGTSEHHEQRSAIAVTKVTAIAPSVPDGTLSSVRGTRMGASPLMVGRDSELRRLIRLATSGRPRVAMVAGEPGIGKSRLIAELLANLPEGTAVLVGQAEPGSLGRPYELLLDALEDVEGVDPDLLAALSDAGRSAVERLHAGVALVARLIGQRPAVVVFEDLHWADSESSALFERVAELPGRTGGNPFFLEELLRGYAGMDLETLGEQPLPWSLAEVLRRQLGELDPATRRVAEAAAVLGQRVPFDLLATVTGEGEEQLITVLRELVARGVLTEYHDDEFGFRHALLREALTGQLLGRQRRRLHEAALDALLAGGEADPALVAHHARAAGRYRDMVEAARRGTESYLAIGSAYQALQLAELGLDEVGDDLQLLAGAARAAWLADLLDDATRYARRWHDLATRPDDRAAALFLLVRLAWDGDDLPEMNARTEELRGLLDQLPPGALQARAMVAIAQSMMLRERESEGIAWTDRAIAIADEYGLPDVKLAALVERGSVLVNSPATLEEGRELLAGLVERAEKAGEWVLAARAINNLVFELPTSSLTEQAELLERMRADAERAGFEAMAVAAYYSGRARRAMAEGDLGKAL